MLLVCFSNPLCHWVNALIIYSFNSHIVRACMHVYTCVYIFICCTTHIHTLVSSYKITSVTSSEAQAAFLYNEICNENSAGAHMLHVCYNELVYTRIKEGSSPGRSTFWNTHTLRAVIRRMIYCNAYEPILHLFLAKCHRNKSVLLAFWWPRANKFRISIKPYK